MVRNQWAEILNLIVWFTSVSARYDSSTSAGQGHAYNTIWEVATAFDFAQQEFRAVSALQSCPDAHFFDFTTHQRRCT